MHYLFSSVKLSSAVMVIGLFTGLVVSGCGPDSKKSVTSSSQRQTELSSIEQPSGEKKSVTEKTAIKDMTYEQGNVSARIASWEQLQQFVDKQSGKIVVVDIWSTWCYPCIKEFPQLVALHNKYPGKVVCVSFNINYDGSSKFPPESNAEEIMDFLVGKKSTLTNFISSTSDEDLYSKIDLASIPVAYVYDTDGVLSKRFDNEKQEYGEEGFSYSKHIVPWIEKLLEQKTE